MTLKFRREADLYDHFARHRAEFGFTTPEEYERVAAETALLNESATLLRCKRANGDTLTYDITFDRFVVVSAEGYIRTMYVPERRLGSTRREYFEEQCQRRQ